MPESSVIREESSDMHLVDNVTWRFGVTVASSEARDASNTFLQVKFEQRDGRSTHVEMDLKQFSDFLTTLEKAQLELERL